MARCLRSTDGFFDGGGVTPSPTPSLQLYKRTYGSVVYLVDTDGKLVTDETVYVEVGASGNPDACVLALCSTNPDLMDIIAGWGITTAVFSSQELGTTDYTITIGDNFVNIVEETPTPNIESFVGVIASVSPGLPWTKDTENMTVNFSTAQNSISVVEHLKVTNPSKTFVVSMSSNNIIVKEQGSAIPLYQITLAENGLSISFTAAEAGGQDGISSIDWV